ncbi:MAG: ABC transporter permease [Nocardioidaceae bacterium]|nr:ABC transporter permease [Nocardioidaceae bacterium]
MTALTFQPAPGARSVARMAWRYALIETRLVLRNAEQLLLALVIPLIVLVVGAKSTGVIEFGAGRRIDVLTPGVLALAVLSTSFASLAIATGFERRYGVLKRLGATPLPRGGLLLGKIWSLLMIQGGQLVLVSLVGWWLGWQPRGGVAGAAFVLLLIALGTAAFAALAMLMAGSLRAEATLAGANLLYVVLVVGGAVLVPLSSYPAGMRDLVTLLPSGALAEGLRETLAGQGLDWSHAAVLAVWAAVAGGLTMRTFRWE